ncbi:hypothetical protein DW1_0821 [Proteiniborus sp. DW1]|uniref:hypothetical protein n=1 Tax=Proteiniborus sp. DW1 TaxID=1889883 RepID=UPI00092E0E57|nr:hypothetical protein [Proteiniborus sp. DW1]SCG82429.1 hypothetical protein DW1_0821 [Proteiniborus sp. DW1]
MKNNLKALLLHFAIVVLSIIFFIILAVSGPTIGKYATHIISRLFIVFILVLAYIFAGRLLDTSANKKYDFSQAHLLQ